MRYLHRCFALIFLAGCWTAFGQTAEEITARALDAMGGKEKLSAIQSIRVHGRVRFGQGDFGPIEVLAARPSMFRVELSVEENHIIEGYDGHNAWRTITGRNQSSGTLSGAEMNRLVDQAANAIGGPLVDAAMRENKIELAGREKRGDKDTFKLKVTLHTGSVMYIYIDATSYKQVAEDLSIQAQGETMILEQALDEFRIFGGVSFPCLIVSTVKGGPEVQHLEIEKVDINPEFDKSTFQIPVSVAFGPRPSGIGQPALWQQAQTGFLRSEKKCDR